MRPDITRDQFLRSYCNPSDDRQPIYQKPFLFEYESNVYVCATEGHAAIMLEATEEDKKLYSMSDKPSMSSFLGARLRIKKRYSLKTLQDIRKTQKDELVKVPKKCQECLGSGTVRYEYHANDDTIHSIEGDCPICDGTGDTDMKSVANEEKYLHVMTDRYGLSVYRVDDIIRALAYFQKDACVILEERTTYSMPYHIKEPEFHLIVMPTYIK